MVIGASTARRKALLVCSRAARLAGRRGLAGLARLAGRRALAGLAGLAGLAWLVGLTGFGALSPAWAAGGGLVAAPGRVVFSVTGGALAGTQELGRVSGIVALPDGGAVLMGGATAPDSGLYLAQLTGAGALDPSFGSAGIVHLTTATSLLPSTLLRQPDGDLVVVASATGASSSSLMQSIVIRLNPDGGLDPSFGSGGTAAVPISAAAASLAPDGDIVLSGATGQLVESGPPVALSGDTTWMLARLTPAGDLDPGFGAGGLVTIPATDANGIAVAALPGGTLVALGSADQKLGGGSVTMLTRLTAAGLADPTFDAGAPAVLPGDGAAATMLAQPDGLVLVGTDTDPGQSVALFRLTGAGALDRGFGAGGELRIPELSSLLALLPAANGTSLAIGASAGGPNTMSAVQITASGRADPALGGPRGVSYRLPFAGGVSSTISARPQGSTPPAADATVIGGPIVERPDGGYLEAAGVSLLEPTGLATGRSIFDVGAAALTPGFMPSAGFGGRGAPLGIRFGLARQRTATARSRDAINVRLELSAPGLTRVDVRARGRVIAAAWLPSFDAAPATLPVGLTSYGRALLAGENELRVSATATARDLAAQSADAATSATLR